MLKLIGYYENVLSLYEIMLECEVIRNYAQALK